jgi:hypothetical protein
MCRVLPSFLVGQIVQQGAAQFAVFKAYASSCRKNLSVIMMASSRCANQYTNTRRHSQPRARANGHLQRLDACSSGSPCAAQLDQRIHRSGQQKRRRIETRHGTSEVHRIYGSPENCSGGMSKTVGKHDDREKVEQRSNPPRSPKYERRQGQQDKNCHDQSGQPFPKLEGRHRPKPSRARSAEENRWKPRR